MISRYTHFDMWGIWTNEFRYDVFCSIEKAHIKALAHEGIITQEDADEIVSRIKCNASDVSKIEEETHHEMFAFLRSIEKNLPEKGKQWVHYGLTSSDVLDTANSLIVKGALNLVYEKADSLLKKLKDLSYKYKYDICIGRTHGQAADVTAFGLKFALWYDELSRGINLLKESERNFCVGKMRGAVGNFIHISPSVEKYAVEECLGLAVPPITTQVVGRDRYADLVSRICLVSGALEHIAMEIRHLARTEINELSEPFGKEQRGSSAMPHKHNPVKCENVCGCARIIRGNMIAAYENVCLWDERDMSHSSAERFILEDSISLLYHMFITMDYVIGGIHVNLGSVDKNMEDGLHNVYIQEMLLKMVENGASRDWAYTKIKERYVDSDEGADEEIRKYLSVKEEEEICSVDGTYEKCKNGADYIYEKVFGKEE